jgi:hypothetical protein
MQKSITAEIAKKAQSMQGHVKYNSKHSELSASFAHFAVLHLALGLPYTVWKGFQTP